MANQLRPTSVTVIALISIIQGAMGLLYVLCCGLFFLGVAVVGISWGEPVDLTGFALMTAFFLLVCVVPAVQLVAGRGLWRMRPWARMFCMIYAVFSLLLAVGLGIFNIAMGNVEAVGEGIVLSLGATLIPLAYCIAVFIVLNLRNVRAAFARAAVGTTNPGGLAAPG
jgi:hypothetical protein